MLHLFRQRGITNAVYGLVIAAIIFAFVVTFRPNATSATASLSETCTARVRGRCITPKDFGAAYRVVLPARGQRELRGANMKRIALDGLIERDLLDDEAARLGISVTDKEVTDMLFAGYIRVSVPAADPQQMQLVLRGIYQTFGSQASASQDVLRSLFASSDMAVPVDFRDPKTKRFDLKVYDRQVKMMSGRSTTEFREEQARELVAAKMRDAIRDPVRVSEAEAWDEYDREHTNATLSYVPVKESWAARWLVDANRGDLDAWVKDHQTDVDATLDQRTKDDAPKAGHIRHILVKLPYGATDVEKAAALAKLSWAAARIKVGEPFAEVARDLSDDTGSAAVGGDVGEKTDNLVLPFKEAADALKPGETTAGAVETQYGYHLIARDDPSKAADVEAQVKRSIIRSMYAKFKGSEAAQVLAKKIATSMHDGTSADDAIADAIAPYVHVQAHPSDVDPLVVLPPPASEVGDGGAAADEATATADAGAAPAATTTSGKPAQKPTARTKKDAARAKGFDASTDPDGPKLDTSGSFNRGGDPLPGLSPDVTAKVMSFAFSSKDGDVLEDPLRSQDAYNVVQLKQHKTATREEFDKEKDTFEASLLAAKRNEALALHVQRLRSQAKDAIKMDESYIQEAKVDGGAPSDDEDQY